MASSQDKDESNCAAERLQPGRRATVERLLSRSRRSTFDTFAGGRWIGRTILIRMSPAYLPESITRAQADALPGPTVLQFGTDWCGYCRAAERVIEPVLEATDGLRRILVEDGKGRPLGRSYRVKLWPTLIFLVDGAEVARVVRPWRSEDLAEAMDLIAR